MHIDSAGFAAILQELVYFTTIIVNRSSSGCKRVVIYSNFDKIFDMVNYQIRSSVLRNTRFVVSDRPELYNEVGGTRRVKYRHF